MSDQQSEFLAAFFEQSSLGMRIVVAACLVGRQGEPVGEFEPVSVSPWYSGPSAEQRVRDFYFDVYRERQGFAHPEDPRGAGFVPHGMTVFSMESEGCPVRMCAGGVGAEPPRGRC